MKQIQNAKQLSLTIVSWGYGLFVYFSSGYLKSPCKHRLIRNSRQFNMMYEKYARCEFVILQFCCFGSKFLNLYKTVAYFTIYQMLNGFLLKITENPLGSSHDQFYFIFSCDNQHFRDFSYEMFNYFSLKCLLFCQLSSAFESLSKNESNKTGTLIIIIPINLRGNCTEL